MNADYLVIGHGLAGATLTWYLRWLGQRVAVVNSPQLPSASRVAAGLITPISGRRHAVSHRFPEFWHEASQFYRRVEAQVGVSFLQERDAFKVASEKVRSTLRKSDTHQPYLGEDVELEWPFRPAQAIALQHAARLDIPAFLDASRRQLQEAGCYWEATLDVEHDLQPCGELLSAESGGVDVQAARVIFCQGTHAVSNLRLSPLGMESVQGEILELAVPELADAATLGHSEQPMWGHGVGQPILLSDIWIVPTGTETCFVGATYNRKLAATQTTEAARAYLLQAFSERCRVHGDVVSHRAGSRPVLRRRLPQFCFDGGTRLGFLNGLGSKGSLRAPLVAAQFAQYLVHGEPVDEEFWYEKALPGETPKRLTTIAQEIVAQSVRPGDLVVDGTAGNGIDTMFLSRAVGPTGHVFAVDIQPEAVARTQGNLAAAGCFNVQLRLGSHADLEELLPEVVHGQLAAVMFNLGYLPRGDKAVTTLASTTLPAIERAMKLLRPGGVMTIVSYPGHTEGFVETLAIEQWANTTSELHGYQLQRPPTKVSSTRPRLYVVHKTDGCSGDPNSRSCGIDKVNKVER